MTLVLESRGEPEALTALAQQEIRAIDPALPVYKAMPLSEVVSESVAEPRFNTFLLSLFAGTAIILAAIGLYGLMAYNVSQRQREIGIRLALGAETRDVLGLVVREGFFLTLWGLAIGLVAAVAASRFLSALLFQITTNDVTTYGVVALVLLAVAIIASVVPAHRASRVDPLIALRYE
jgi:putative ABC transport system permease protein